MSASLFRRCFRDLWHGGKRDARERAERQNRGVKPHVIQRLRWRPFGNLMDGRPDLDESVCEGILGRSFEVTESVPEDYEYELTDAEGNQISMSLLWVGLPHGPAGGMSE